MQPVNDLDARFGSEAAEELAGLLALPPDGDPSFSPAPLDRIRGAMIGVLAGEALPAVLQNKQPVAGPFTRLTRMTADAVLSRARDHPAGFAAHLAAAEVDEEGMAIRHTQDSLRAGIAWWQAGATNSAGTDAAARSTCFGLLWAGDPQRAAYEAALSATVTHTHRPQSFGLLWSDDPDRAAYEAAISATVTHSHPAAIAGAAAFAAAVALAASGEGPLDNRWLADVSDTCAATTVGHPPPVYTAAGRRGKYSI